MFRFGRPQEDKKATRAARLVFSWPILLVLGGLGCSLVYKSATLHPIYGIGIFLPYHMVWHNAYMGMGLHPDWNERGDKHHGKPIPDQGSDNMAWKAAVAEAEERYGLSEAYTVNGEVGGLPGIKMALHEKLIKERFLRFAYQHPRFMLELMLWYKPKWLLREFGWIYSDYAWNVWSLLCLTVFMVIAAMTIRWLKIPPHVRSAFSSAILVTGVISLAPPFWTYPLRHVLGEQFFIWTAILLYFAALLLSKAWSVARPVAELRA
jgi:hypothetical protein